MSRRVHRLLILLSVLPLVILAGACGAGQRRPASGPSPAEGIYEGVVLAEVASGTRPSLLGGPDEQFQTLQVRLVTGDRKGQVITAENGQLDPSGSGSVFRKGERVQVAQVFKPGPEEFIVIDHVRRPVLYALALLFALATAAVGRWRGVLSLAGLAASFFVLVFGMLPQLLAGRNPIAVSVLGAIVIMVATLYLAHGVNRKTTVAIVGTAASLTLTGILAWTFIKLAHISGVTSEEAFYLQVQGQSHLNLQGLLLAGIIVGGLGVLDDITVSQAAIIFALRAANPRLDWAELYRRAMTVGRDHIASTVNTLVLAYAGANLPLLLLFVSYDVPFSDIINREFMAAEIIQTLVGSLGLISAVPITTALAASVSTRMASAAVEREHGATTHPHSHFHSH